MPSLLLAERIKKARASFVSDYRYLEGILKAIKRG
jgi:hypothetical protein